MLPVVAENQQVQCRPLSMFHLLSTVRPEAALPNDSLPLVVLSVIQSLRSLADLGDNQ